MPTGSFKPILHILVYLLSKSVPMAPCNSVRIGLHYRALAIRKLEYLLWFWIGSHAEYDKMLSRL